MKVYVPFPFSRWSYITRRLKVKLQLVVVVVEFQLSSVTVGSSLQLACPFLDFGTDYHLGLSLGIRSHRASLKLLST